MNNNMFPRPVISPVKNGYIAKTPAKSRCHFAVIGKSRDEAAALYERESSAREELITTASVAAVSVS